MNFLPGDFSFAPAPPGAAPPLPPPKPRAKRPWAAFCLLGLILLGCALAGALAPRDPGYLDLSHIGAPPSPEFWFGTDPMGRDLFSMIWHGGRVSLLVGCLAAAISTAIALLYGSVSGVAPAKADAAMMRFIELSLSGPAHLLGIFLKAVIGRQCPAGIALVVGVTGWMQMAQVVRGEVRRLRHSAYVLAARTMKAGFWHILRRHLLPNLLSPLMFMVVTNISAAIATESTLSFLGLGLPVGVVSWGSLLSQADRALLSGSWWVIVIPGVFLITTLVSITDIGNYIRREGNKTCSNL